MKNTPIIPTELSEINLRDWFAGMALSALIQKDTEYEKFALLSDAEPPASHYDQDGNVVCAVARVMQPDGTLSRDFWEGVARESYIVADAMLAARLPEEVQP